MLLGFVFNFLICKFFDSLCGTVRVRDGVVMLGRISEFGKWWS